MNKQQLKLAVANAQKTLTAINDAADVAADSYKKLKSALADLQNKEAEDVRRSKENPYQQNEQSAQHKIDGVSPLGLDLQHLNYMNNRE